MQLHNNIKLIKNFQQVASQVKLFQSKNILKRNSSHADSIFLRQDDRLYQAYVHRRPAHGPEYLQSGLRPTGSLSA